MESVVAKKPDWLFRSGMLILIVGYYSTLALGRYFVIGIIVHMIGAFMIANSGKSRNTKLWIIIPSFVVNYATGILIYGLLLKMGLFPGN